MAMSEAFIPVSTKEEDSYTVPVYSPDGPEQDESGNFGVASGSAVPHPTLPGARQNHLYFNYCCDCRRAVLVINIISVVINIVNIVLVNVGMNYMFQHPEDMESQMSAEDAAKFDAIVKSGKIQMIEALMDAFIVIAIGLHVCGIYGALKFKKWGIVTGGSAYIVNGVFGLLRFDIPKMILAGVMGYPHYFLVKEINEGIMTDYNYHNVAACCGGV
jgi:hypothetical protein